MKKLLLLLVVVLPTVSNAYQVWFTNSTAVPLTVGRAPLGIEEGTDLTIELTAGNYGGFTFDLGNALYTSQLTESWFLPPQDGQDYTVNFTDETVANFVPVAVPEPTAFSLFIVGFCLTFGTGLMATGARWVRQLVVGSTETL